MMTHTDDTPRRVELVPIDQIKPYSRNAKHHDQTQVAKIAESIRQFGFTNPILIDEHGEILAGHGRYLAAQQIGLIRVPPCGGSAAKGTWSPSSVGMSP